MCPCARHGLARLRLAPTALMGLGGLSAWPALPSAHCYLLAATIGALCGEPVQGPPVIPGHGDPCLGSWPLTGQDEAVAASLGMGWHGGHVVSASRW